MNDINKNFKKLIIYTSLTMLLYVVMAFFTSRIWVEAILIILILAVIFYTEFKIVPRIVFEDLKELKVIKNSKFLYKYDNLTIILVGYTLQWLFIVFVGLFMNHFSFKNQYGTFFSLIMYLIFGSALGIDFFRICKRKINTICKGENQFILKLYEKASLSILSSVSVFLIALVSLLVIVEKDNEEVVVIANFLYFINGFITLYTPILNMYFCTKKIQQKVKQNEGIKVQLLDKAG